MPASLFAMEGNGRAKDEGMKRKVEGEEEKREGEGEERGITELLHRHLHLRENREQDISPNAKSSRQRESFNTLRSQERCAEPWESLGWSRWAGHAGAGMVEQLSMADRYSS